MKNQWVVWASVAVLAVCALISAARGSQNAIRQSQDFQWDASRVLLLRADPYRPNPAWMPVERAKFTAEQIKLSGGITGNQPPSCLILLWPFAALRWPDAKLAWLLCNLAMTAGIVALARRLWFRDLGAAGTAAFGCLLVCSTPWRENLGNGQHTIFALFFFLLGCLQARSGRRLFAGLFLAVSLFKFTVTGPLVLWAALDGAFAAFLVALAVHAALTLFSGWWLGLSPLVLVQESLRVSGKLAFLGSTDVWGCFSVLAGPHRGAAAVPAAGAFIVASALALVWACRRQRADGLRCAAMAACWSLLVVYHRYYDLVALLFVEALLARDRAASWRHRVLALILVELWFAQRALETGFGSTGSLLEGVLPFVEVFAAFVVLAFLPAAPGGRPPDEKGPTPAGEPSFEG